VTGPKGTLSETFSPDIEIRQEDAQVVLARPTESKNHRALHGLTRALLANMVTGVTTGFERTLIIAGVGYRVAQQGTGLNLSLGYSHPITVEPPEGVTLSVESPTMIKVTGISKQKVGQMAADIRKLRKPEPYKGKGIRYDNERIRRKAGKAGSK
jgi:large subunit ribosomal protein L6